MRLSCSAYSSAVKHCSVAKIVAFIGRQKLSQFKFNLFRVFRVNKTYAV